MLLDSCLGTAERGQRKNHRVCHCSFIRFLKSRIVIANLTEYEPQLHSTLLQLHHHGHDYPRVKIHAQYGDQATF